MNTSKALDLYIELFSSLNTDRARWKGNSITRERAPHKPLLLLSLIEQFRLGIIRTNLVRLNRELSEAFYSYWYCVKPLDRSGNAVLPFFHLRSDGFWQLVPAVGSESALASIDTIRSMSDLERLVIGARLDDNLYDLLQHENYREALFQVLLTTYFSTEAQRAILGQSQANVEAIEYSRSLLENNPSPNYRSVIEPVRLHGFRIAIASAYENRCAMSGIRIITPTGNTVINAAHIVPWSISHNDSLSNGLALSPLCHWAFDKGLISIDRHLRIVLSSYLRHEGNISGELLTLEGRQLILPRRKEFYPDENAIEYHRKEIYLR